MYFFNHSTNRFALDTKGFPTISPGRTIHDGIMNGYEMGRHCAALERSERHFVMKVFALLTEKSVGESRVEFESIECSVWPTLEIAKAMAHDSYVDAIYAWGESAYKLLGRYGGIYWTDEADRSQAATFPLQFESPFCLVRGEIRCVEMPDESEIEVRSDKWWSVPAQTERVPQ